MARTKLTDSDKLFIVRYNDTMLVREMGKELGVYTDPILKYLKEVGLKTLYKKKNPAKSKPITPAQEAYVLLNYQHKTISEIARHINNTNFSVKKILDARGLSAKKIKSRDVPFEPEIYDVVEQKFERPPAVYSNPQWNELYKD